MPITLSELKSYKYLLKPEKMHQPIISVIIPCYKAEKYIGSCLDMMMKQSYKHLELIVVIDGVFDRSEEIASNYPVKIIRFEKNRGASAGRNAGIEAASGKYIHFMDVDDKINKDFYLNLVSAAEETGADIACSSMYNEKKAYQCHIFKKRKIATGIKDKLLLTWVSKWGYACRYLFNMDMLRSSGIRFEEGRYIEDLPFSVMVLYYAKKIVTAADTIYFYVNNPVSSLNNKDEGQAKKRHDDEIHSIMLIKNFAKEKGISLPGRTMGIHKIQYILRKYFVILFKQGCNRRYIAKYGF